VDQRGRANRHDGDTCEQPLEGESEFHGTTYVRRAPRGKLTVHLRILDLAIA
jgi:hypothetical protein